MELQHGDLGVQLFDLVFFEVGDFVADPLFGELPKNDFLVLPGAHQYPAGLVEVELRDGALVRAPGVDALAPFEGPNRDSSLLVARDQLVVLLVVAHDADLDVAPEVAELLYELLLPRHPQVQNRDVALVRRSEQVALEQVDFQPPNRVHRVRLDHVDDDRARRVGEEDADHPGLVGEENPLVFLVEEQVRVPRRALGHLRDVVVVVEVDGAELAVARAGVDQLLAPVEGDAHDAPLVRLDGDELVVLVELGVLAGLVEMDAPRVESDLDDAVLDVVVDHAGLFREGLGPALLELEALRVQPEREHGADADVAVGLLFPGQVHVRDICVDAARDVHVATDDEDHVFLFVVVEVPNSQRQFVPLVQLVRRVEAQIGRVLLEFEEVFYEHRARNVLSLAALPQEVLELNSTL